MELRLKEGHLQDDCYWVSSENGEIKKTDRKDSVIYIPKFLTGVTTGEHR